MFPPLFLGQSEKRKRLPTVGTTCTAALDNPGLVAQALCANNSNMSEKWKSNWKVRLQHAFVVNKNSNASQQTNAGTSVYAIDKTIACVCISRNKYCKNCRRARNKANHRKTTEAYISSQRQPHVYRLNFLPIFAPRPFCFINKNRTCCSFATDMCVKVRNTTKMLYTRIPRSHLALPSYAAVSDCDRAGLRQTDSAAADNHTSDESHGAVGQSRSRGLRVRSIRRNLCKARS